ncbi:MAG: hypothetical protein SGILL_007452, partial [Bacillariaceae sp.]
MSSDSSTDGIPAESSKQSLEEIQQQPPPITPAAESINLSSPSVIDSPSSPKSHDDNAVNLPASKLPQPEEPEQVESQQPEPPEEQQQKQEHPRAPRLRSWKNSMVASWKNRRASSNVVDSVDRTSGALENSLQGDSEHADNTSSSVDNASAAVSTATVVNYDDLLTLPPKKI